jgi:RHS repeat-associated protein
MCDDYGGRMPITPAARRRTTTLVLALAAGAALVTGAVSPAAAEVPVSSAPAGSVALGAIGLVDGLSGAFSEREGGFGFDVPAGGLRLAWDSRMAGANRYGLGYGWSWPVSHVQTEGGVRVFASSGGVFEADSTHPTGLASYGERDLLFEQRAGTLPGRAGEPEVQYDFALRELGGELTYFNADGDPVATVTASGRRTDWRWGAPGAHRLDSVVDPDEVVTTIDWAGHAGGVEIERGSNLPAEPGRSRPVWFVETDGSAVRSVTGPTDESLRFTYDEPAQLITSIHGATGGETRLEWRGLDDGTTRVERVSTLMAGETLATRSWSGDAAAPGAWARSAGSTTTVTDGDASVVSAYDVAGRLTNRKLVIATPAGEQVTRDERLTYDAVDGEADASAAAVARARPSATETVFIGASGATRTETTSLAYDAFGRTVEGVDGTLTAYDAANRPVLETADGTDTSFGYWADGTRRERATATEATTFYWDGATMVTDVHADPVGGAEAGSASYLIGNARHARTVATPDGALDTRYSGTDRHGNVTDVTTAAGELVERYEYSDYGVQRRLPTGTEPFDELHRMPYGYSGEYTDPSGRQHLAARTYEPETMRFTSVDTAKLHNLYAYADLNPITKVDPTGHEALDDFLGFWLPQVIIPIGVGLLFGISALGALGPGTGAAMLRVAGFVGQAVGIGGVAFSLVNDLALPEPILSKEHSRWLSYASGALAALGSVLTGLLWEGVKNAGYIAWTGIKAVRYAGRVKVRGVTNTPFRMDQAGRVNALPTTDRFLDAAGISTKVNPSLLVKTPVTRAELDALRVKNGQTLSTDLLGSQT